MKKSYLSIVFFSCALLLGSEKSKIKILDFAKLVKRSGPCVPGAVSFEIHGEKECFLLRGIGITKNNSTQCPGSWHKVYNDQVAIADRTNHSLLVFIDREDKTVDGAIIKITNNEDLSCFARTLLDPKIKPLVSYVECEINQHGKIYIHFIDKHKKLLTTIMHGVTNPQDLKRHLEFSKGVESNLQKIRDMILDGSISQE